MKLLFTAFILGGFFLMPQPASATLPLESQAFLDAHSDVIANLHVEGGTGSVDDASVDAAAEAAEQNDDTNAPTPGTDPATTPDNPSYGNGEVCDALCQSERMY
jgi:hypothetical protein